MGFFDFPDVFLQAVREVENDEPPDAPGAGIEVDLGEDDEVPGPSRPSRADRRGTFSSENPDAFDAIKEQLKGELVSQGFTRVEERDLSSRINQAARIWFSDQGQWPSVFDLMGYQTLWDMLLPYVTGMTALPGVFESDGALYRNDPWLGVKLTSTGAFESTQQLGLDPRLFEGMDQAELNFLNRAQPTPAGRLVHGLGIPSLTMDDIAEAMARAAPVPRRGGGGGRRGGGGGAGRAPRPFDKAELLEAANTMESSLLRRDPQAAQAWVDAYMKEAQAFWMSDGGNLDFETFILNRIRADSEYAGLYRHKPPQMSERQFAALYENVTGGGGLNPDQQEVFTQRGMRQGLAFQGIGEQVAQSRPVQRRGGFVDRLAGAVQAIGARG